MLETLIGIGLAIIFICAVRIYIVLHQDKKYAQSLAYQQKHPFSS